MMGAVRALRKVTAGPGLELVDVPEPECGDKDVKIRVLRAGLCGTDLHLEQWDEWAAATVQVPMTLGHEFFGEVVEVGADVDHVAVGDRVSGEGHIVCGSCRNCRAGRRHLCINTVGRRGQPRRRLRRLRRHPGDQRLGAAGRPRPRPRRAVRPARQRDPHGAAVAGRRRGRASSPAPGRSASWRPRSCGTPGPAGSASPTCRPSGWPWPRRPAPTSSSTSRPAGRCARRRSELGMVEGFDIGLEMSGSPLGGRGHAREHEPRRPGGAARPAQGPLRHRLGPGHHAHDHAARHLRPRDVRDLVPHGLDAGDLARRCGRRCRRSSPAGMPRSEWQAAFAETRSGQGGKVVLDWS